MHVYKTCDMTLIPSMFRIYLDVQVTKCLVLSGVNAQKCDISNLCCALTSRVQVMGKSCQNVRFPQSFLYRWPEQVGFYRMKLYIRRDIPWQLWQLKSAIKEAVFVTDIDWVPCFVRKFHVIKYFLLLRRMQLACTGWLESLNSRDVSRDENIWTLSKTQRDAWPSFHWSVRFFVYSKPKSNLCSTHNA
jgi:hypothetical protein